MSNRLTTAIVVSRARETHGDKYLYDRTEFLGCSAKVVITCRTHGDFLQLAHNHFKGNGCPTCKRDVLTRVNTDTDVKGYIRRARETHGSRYDYSKLKLFGNAKVKIICRTHGEFEQDRHSHTNGNGCPKCSPTALSNTEEFIRKAKRVHGKTYLYARTEYTHSGKQLTITCKQHGDFKLKADYHLQGKGCPACRPTGHSKVAIRWIEYEARRRGMQNVLHAESGGEYRIPGTRYRVDGYHAETNTVFEFYGDCFHGNPKMFPPKSKCNPFSDKSASQLWWKTIRRTAHLKQLGYNVISIWEREFRTLGRIHKCNKLF